VVGHVRLLLLGVILLDLAFQWDANPGYRDDAAKLGAIGGLNLSVTTLALAGLYGMWIAQSLLRPGAAPAPQIRAALPLLAYVGLTALSVTWARDAGLGWYETALLVQLALLFVYVASTIRTRAEVQFLVVVLLAGLVVESLLIAAAFHTGESFNFAGLSTHNSTFDARGFRPAGTLGSPNSAGAYLALMLLPAAAVLLTKLHPGTRILAGVALGAGLYALIVTQSRGSWMALAFGMLLLFGVAVRERWLTGSVAMWIAVAVAVIGVLGGGLVLQRLTGDDQGAAESRVPLMRLAEKVIRDNPVLGVGANNFPVVIEEYAGPEMSGGFIYTVHNKYLLVWSEAGLAALVAFLWFLGSAFVRGWRCSLAGDPLLSPLALGLTAAIAGRSVAMLVDLFRGRADMQPLILFAGLLVAFGAMIAASHATAPGPVAVRE
jgi:O-antigen ligase